VRAVGVDEATCEAIFGHCNEHGCNKIRVWFSNILWLHSVVSVLNIVLSGILLCLSEPCNYITN
jgi:hypothetical protein